MLALELAVRLLLGLGLFQRDDLRLGQHQAFLRALGLQRLEPLLHGLQVMTQPDAADAGRRDRKPALAQLVGDPNLPESGLFNGERDNGVLDRLRHAVLQHWLLAADLLQSQFAAWLVKLLEPVEAIPAVAHHLAGLADVAELLGELQQSNFGADDLLFGRHGVLQCAEAGRYATPTAPRPASACDSPWGQDTSVMEWIGRAPKALPSLFRCISWSQGARIMTTSAIKETITTIGIDLGKNVFHIVGMNARGAIVVRERLSRAKLPRRLANVTSCLIGMEACAGAHHVGRQLATLGHQIRLIPAKYVKPFLKGHKNDYRDAEAIAEAVQRPTMRFVQLKSTEQLDLQALHRVRSRLIGQRTAVINQIRGFLLEHGIAIRQGPAGLRQALPNIFTQRTDELSPLLLRLLKELADDWRQLDARIDDTTNQIETLTKQDENCKRLMGVSGVGPVIASAMVAAIGDGAAFVKGRDFAAWLGLVPKQISTGDRTILGGISRRGNRYSHHVRSRRTFRSFPA